MPGRAKLFIKQMLQPEVTQRLGADMRYADVKANAFFATVDWAGLEERRLRARVTGALAASTAALVLPE